MGCGLVVAAVHFVVAMGLWLGGAPEPGSSEESTELSID